MTIPSDIAELNSALARAIVRNTELQSELQRREEWWVRRCERILDMKIDPPMLIVDKDVFSGRLSMEPGTIVSDEWSKIRRSVIETEDIYLKDFLRSLWRRLRGRRPL